MNTSSKKFMIVSGLITAAWVLVMITFLRVLAAGSFGILAVVGGIVAFVVASVSVSNWEKGAIRSPDLTEINALGYIFSSVYLGAALIINAILCAIGIGHLFSPMIPVAVNLVLLAIQIGMTAYLPHYQQRTAYVTGHAAEKINPYVQISAKLSSLIALSDNERVKMALRKLKEQVDYSSNVSNNYTKESENNFFQELLRIQDKIENEDSEEEIMRSISKADRLWKSRNSIHASIR